MKWKGFYWNTSKCSGMGNNIYMDSLYRTSEYLISHIHVFPLERKPSASHLESNSIREAFFKTYTGIGL